MGARRSALGARHSAAGGFTLVEMMVVMTLIGVVAGVAAMSLGVPDNDREPAEARLAMARDSAARHGIAVTVAVDSSADGGVLLVLPDGRLIGDGMELMTDATDNAAR